MEAWADVHGIDVAEVATSDLEGLPAHSVAVPRIALLHTWSRTQDEGWARFSLDQQGVPYDYLGEDKIAELGDLRARYDVILFPHQGARATAKKIFQGVDPKYGPLAFTRTDEFPSHGTPDSTEDMTGGMGFEGLGALHRFVQNGGTLLAIGSAGTLPVDYGFLREVSLGEVGDMFVPGSILRGTVTDQDNPLTYGYGDDVPLYHQWGPYFDVPDSESAGVAVRYASGDDLLLSGVARRADPLSEQAAVYAGRVGRGWVVLYGFDALHRHQNLGNHALVWNAILNWNHLGVHECADEEPMTPDAGSGP